MLRSDRFRLAVSLVAYAIVIGGNLTLGLRGLSRETVDFFAMKPFSDPIVRCVTRVSTQVGVVDAPSPFPILRTGVSPQPRS